MASSVVDEKRIRLFLGVFPRIPWNELPLSLPEGLRKGYKEVPPSLRHITLLFLGEQEEKILPALGDSLSKEPPLSSFTSRLFSVGVFPSPRKARVHFVGVDPPSPWVTLHRWIWERIGKSFFVEKKEEFVPHLTLGRWKISPPYFLLKEYLRSVEDFSGEEFFVSSYLLVRSELTSRGPVYTTIQEFPLR